MNNVFNSLRGEKESKGLIYATISNEENLEKTKDCELRNFLLKKSIILVDSSSKSYVFQG